MNLCTAYFFDFAPPHKRCDPILLPAFNRRRISGRDIQMIQREDTDAEPYRDTGSEINDHPKHIRSGWLRLDAETTLSAAIIRG